MKRSSSNNGDSPDLDGMIAHAMADNIRKIFENCAGMVASTDNATELSVIAGMKRAKLVYDMMMRNKGKLQPPTV
jgi:hypothetical protein